VPLSGATRCRCHFIFSNKAFEPAAWAAMVFADIRFRSLYALHLPHAPDFAYQLLTLPVSLDAMGMTRHHLWEKNEVNEKYSDTA
jgi:hypothetical protein